MSLAKTLKLKKIISSNIVLLNSISPIVWPRKMSVEQFTRRDKSPIRPIIDSLTIELEGQLSF